MALARDRRPVDTEAVAEATGPTGGTIDEARRCREAGLAGHEGREGTARAFLADPSPQVRATALGALSRMAGATPADVRTALADGDPVVRRRGCQVAVVLPEVDLVPQLHDDDPLVVEAAAGALAERGEGARAAVPQLAVVANGHADPLCREAAVAALGAIGAPEGLPAVLAATADRATVRRRAVIALAAFQGAEVEAALRRALEDRDWQVRQAAEDLLAGSSGGR